MKVAMVTTTGPRCGIAAYSRDLITALEQVPGIDVEVVPIVEGCQPREFYADQARRLNAPDLDVVHIQHEYSFWGSIFPLRSQPIAIAGIALHLASGARSSTFLSFKQMIKTPLVVTVHTTLSVAGAFEAGAVALRSQGKAIPPHWRAIRKLTLNNRRFCESVERLPFLADATIVHTDEARRLLNSRNLPKVTVIPAGIPEAFPALTEGESFRHLHGLGGRRILTIFGYIAPMKGYELALDALRALPGDVSLVIAGGPRTSESEPYAQALSESVARQGLADRVVMTGYVDDVAVAEVMAATDLVLAPHTVATGSYSVAIALAHGKPILASDQACFRELVERGASVETFPLSDPGQLAERASQLLDDRPSLNRLAARAPAYAAAESWRCVAMRTAAVYREVIEGRGKPGPAV